MCIAILIIHKPTLKPFIPQVKAGQLLTNRLIELFAERIKSQIEASFQAEQLLAPIELITHHIASAQIGLVTWWIENDQPYSPEYMAQISIWLSLAGSARGFGLEDLSVAPPTMPENV